MSHLIRKETCWPPVLTRFGHLPSRNPLRSLLARLLLGWLALALVAAYTQGAQSKSPPKRTSQDIEVFRDHERPTRAYKEVRTLTDDGRLNEEGAIEEKFKKEAAKLGADAIIISPKVPSGVEGVPFGGLAYTYLYKALVLAYLPPDETGGTNGQQDLRRTEAGNSAGGRPRATGTAFFITDDGYLLTSAHVVEDAARIEAFILGKRLQAQLVKADKANDVAVLKIAGNFNALPLTASRTVKLGDTICTLGFPNTDIQGIEPKFTTGEINSLGGIQDDPRHFQISVAVQPGNSGGPLLDSSGNVIGLVSARLADVATLKATGSLPQNVNYALKSSFITAFLETLPEVSAKLKAPRPVKQRPLSEVAGEVKPSVALVTVY